MVRFLGILVGLGFVAALLWSFGWGAAAYVSDPPQASVESLFHKESKEIRFAQDGPFGMYDKEQLQRGLQVYSEVCKACHSLKLVAFGDLEGLGYKEAEIKAFAKQWDVPDINPDTGEPTTRKGLPSDHFPSPFANDVAARAANNNALPPDLSDMAKAREGGPRYIYSLLTGFRDPATYRNEKGGALPAENRPGPNLHFNPWFANLNIAMPPPLTSTGQVTYADGKQATVDQMAQDVSAFLAWTAEPKMEARKKTGISTIVFLLLLTVLTYLAYRNVWADEKHRRVRATGPLDPEHMAKSRQASGEAGVLN
jgi:ubiquinol-cytochrome c reductase cytochrome c1 subunit